VGQNPIDLIGNPQGCLSLEAGDERSIEKRKKEINRKISGNSMIKKIEFYDLSVITCWIAFFMVCLVLCLVFHPNALILLMSRSVFLSSPLQPLRLLLRL
jgi:hypothetical protein